MMQGLQCKELVNNTFAAKFYQGVNMDLKNLNISEIETGINKALVSKTDAAIELQDDQNILIEIYGYMICYRIKVLNLDSFVDNNQFFSIKHIEAVQKYCS